MPPFPTPKFRYTYDLGTEVQALRRYERTKPGRDIPDKAPNRLLVATWNVANLGVQKRRERDYRLIAEMLGWFDLAAIQEVNENLAGLRAIQQHLPGRYHVLFSDSAGNRERLVYLYDSTKVSLLEKVGEVAVPPSQLRYIKLPGVRRKFDGFDRTPYIAAFKAGGKTFVLVNVHLYFGSEKRAKDSMDRRSLETFAVAWWADHRRKSKYAYSHNVVALGDFNLPKIQPGDLIYKALTSRGLRLPDHSTEIGSSIASESHYDQIAFFPGEVSQAFTGRAGVFDFDGAVFAGLWQKKTRAQFLAYVRYYLSDHRILWAEFRI